MKCPNCCVELEKDFFEKTVTFRCPSCRGRMLTISGLRSLCSDKKFVNLLWSTAQHGYAETGPACGSCMHTMRRVTLPLAGTALEVDLCNKCQFIWFDPTELERIPLPVKDAEEKLPQKAREILAMHQLQQSSERINQSIGGTYHSDDMPDYGWQYIAALFRLPVELDSPSCSKRPILTWIMALICLGAFILTFPHLRSTVDQWGFIPSEWTRHYGLTLITSMFLHGSVVHLLGNLYFLVIFGDNVEDLLGKWKYLCLFLISGLSASFLHALFDARSTIPCIGASGFISGIIACYAVCLPRVKLSFMIFPRVFLFAMSRYNWLAIPAWGAFGIWIVFQIVMAALESKSNSGGVAYMAHIGGAIPGLLFGAVYRMWIKNASVRPEQEINDLEDVRKL